MDDETKLRIIKEFPEVNRRIERDWPYGPHQEAAWELACLVWHFAFQRGITHGLEQSGKIMSFAFEKLNQSFDKAHGKTGDGAVKI